MHFINTFLETIDFINTFLETIVSKNVGIGSKEANYL